MQVVPQLVTPEQAQCWLDNQATNRRLKLGRIKRYAREMAVGAWRTDTIEGICLNHDGRMIDGQNRCHAVILYGKPVMMAVAHGVGVHFGTGRSRTAQDEAKIVYHVDLSKRTFAIVSVLLQSDELTTDEKLKFYKTHKEAIDFADRIGGHNKSTGTASILAVYARAFYHEDHDRIREFASILNNGITTKVEDIAAIRLREQLLTTLNRVGGGSGLRREVYARTENALYKFCRYQGIDKLYRAKDELFPLPSVDAYELT